MGSLDDKRLPSAGETLHKQVFTWGSVFLNLTNVLLLLATVVKQKVLEDDELLFIRVGILGTK